MSLGRIVVYKGKFIYDVVNVFADLIAGGFRAAGYEVAVIDLTKGVSFLEELKPVVERGDCKMIFSFAGAGAELQVQGGRFLHDILPVPFVAAMVDNPAHFPGRLALRNIAVGCFDKSHCDYVKRRCGEDKKTFFLPHGGCPPPHPFASSFEARTHEIVFPGSFLNPEDQEKTLSTYPPEGRRIVSLALEIAKKAGNEPSHLALEKAASSVGFDLSDPARYAFLMDRVFLPFEHLLRGTRRIEALKALDDAGISVEIFGDGWPSGLFKNHLVKPALSFNQTMDVMARSKIVLNIRAIPGAHERVCSAAMAGALSLSDFSSCVASEFKEGEEIAFYRWNSLEALPEIARGLLSDVPRMDSLASAGRVRAFADHTWANRAVMTLQALGLPSEA